MKKFSILIPLITSVLCVALLTRIHTTNEFTFSIPYSSLTTEARRQVDCLTDNIFFEAGIESTEGKTAVALVTLNRTVDDRFPKDICSVVKQKTTNSQGQQVCQFSWFCEPAKTGRDSYAYRQSKSVALDVYANYEKLVDITNGALFYHTKQISPGWNSLEKTVIIGNHVFYVPKT